MPKTNPIADKDMPEYVRRCWHYYQAATVDIREASNESKRMWLGGKFQWRDGEINARISNNLPWVTINRLKPAVDQVSNEARGRSARRVTPRPRNPLACRRAIACKCEDCRRGSSNGP